MQRIFDVCAYGGTLLISAVYAYCINTLAVNNLVLLLLDCPEIEEAIAMLSKFIKENLGTSISTILTYFT